VLSIIYASALKKSIGEAESRVWGRDRSAPEVESGAQKSVINLST
jgi:hypothetical protein